MPAQPAGRCRFAQDRLDHNPAQPTGNSDYELLEMLGQGGMGVVYKARQASIDRHVAVKMVKTDSVTEKQRRSFVSEAVITGELDHPNIVPIYDLGTDESGALFYSMKQVVGTPWKDVIRKKSQAENLEILMRVADAVAFGHSRGVVHCDLKPENVMLGGYGEVLVMDWGLAQLLPAFQKPREIAKSADGGGTPAYMAPEMAVGKAGLITIASDVYLLGAILYEIITGKAPHAGKNVMDCLVNVAKNVIQPTDKTGELLGHCLPGDGNPPRRPLRRRAGVSSGGPRLSIALGKHPPLRPGAGRVGRSLRKTGLRTLRPGACGVSRSGFVVERKLGGGRRPRRRPLCLCRVCVSKGRLRFGLVAAHRKTARSMRNSIRKSRPPSTSGKSANNGSAGPNGLWRRWGC